MAVKLNIISVTVTIPNVRVSGAAGTAKQPVKFYTVAALATYQGTNSLGIGYVADLARLQGKVKADIDSVERASNNIVPDKYSYSDGAGFSFVDGGDILEGEYIVINFH